MSKFKKGDKVFIKNKKDVMILDEYKEDIYTFLGWDDPLCVIGVDGRRPFLISERNIEKIGFILWLLLKLKGIIKRV
ncbi:hypothetical protein [Cetobacterium sp.]|uniref:hypothetical protein n=1 Tax=Cetobacterium sp. TaxID=2071632 RepID=UPI003F303A4A